MPEEKLDIELYTETDKPLILIVEDNADVRNYIKGHLDKVYRLMEANDGEEGLNKSHENIPDLVISDVMMPKMDGFQLCEKIKTDARTSHIPVILLTAKASGQDKIEGLETGADDYIMKPFDSKELMVRVKNLIEQRKKIVEHFKNNGLFEVSNLNITSRDKQFISKAIEIINKNISAENFDVNTLAGEIGLSRVQLHRKLTALIGHPSGDLIRIIRLTKAAKLIQSNFGNISEIAIEVGFNNPANFAKAFRAHFGVSPSEYKKNPVT
jgi:DNA-binding response OmpR family regulator